jgi:hypothetical protein
VDDSGTICDEFGMVGGLVGCMGRLLGISGESRGFAVAAPEDFQEFRQQVGGLWVGYLVGDFVEQNPCG